MTAFSLDDDQTLDDQIDTLPGNLDATVVTELSAPSRTPDSRLQLDVHRLR